MLLVAISIPSALLISTPSINEAFSFATLQLAGYLLFMEASSVNPRDGCGIVKIPEDQQPQTSVCVFQEALDLVSTCARRSQGKTLRWAAAPAGRRA